MSTIRLPANPLNLTRVIPGGKSSMRTAVEISITLAAMGRLIRPLFSSDPSETMRNSSGHQ